MWLIAKYKSTTLFSLKESNATSKGAKSLIVPSQYAIKLTIINSFIQKYSIKKLEKNFCWIKSLEILVKSSCDIVVNNCFLRIQTLSRGNKNEYQSTVAFREYVYLNNPIYIAINIDKLDNEKVNILKSVLVHINYFGKRGCFFQIIPDIKGNFFKEKDNLDYGYGQKLDKTNYLTSLLYELDDFGQKIHKFSQVNNYKKDKTDRNRIKYCFPYELKSSSRKYYHYQMLNED